MVKKLYVIAVAPHTGAWIETDIEISTKEELEYVVPHTGAWIETFYIDPLLSIRKMSLPIRERGLKLDV